MIFSLVRTASLAVLVCLYAPITAAAQILIDDFSSGGYVSPLNSTDTEFDHLDLGSMLGGERRSYGKASSPNNVDATLSVDGGQWCMADASGGIQWVSTTWGQTNTLAATSDQPLNLDISAEDQFFQYDLASVEQTTRISVRLYSGIDEGNAATGGVNELFTTSSSTPQTVSINFNDLAYSLIDFTDIDGLEIRLEFPSTDFCITEFRIGNAVPEPGHLVLLAGSLCWLVRQRRP